MSKKKIFTILQFALFAFVLYRIVPQFYSHWQKQGQSVKSFEVLNLVTTQKEQLFINSKNFVIFWASWCAPCKLEMNRVKSLVEAGNVRADQVIALNPFETDEAVKTFLQQQSYPFRFLSDEGRLSSSLDVKSTPTFLWIKDETIEEMSSGIHLTGLFRLEKFLAQ